MKHVALLLTSALIAASCAQGLDNDPVGGSTAGGAGGGASSGSGASSDAGGVGGGGASSGSGASSDAGGVGGGGASSSSGASSGAGGVGAAGDAGGGAGGSGGAGPEAPTNLVVQYKVEISGAANSAIGSQLWIVNNSSGPVNLEDLSLRYYLTNEVSAELVKNINWANIGPVGGPNANFPAAELTIAVMPLAVPVASADTYLEFGFKPGNNVLPVGHRLQFSWTVQNFAAQQFTQTGDYSFSSAAVAQMDWPNVVLLFQGSSVVWGVEP